MLIRLVFIAVSAAILGTLHHAEAYTWPAIRYSPPNSCGKNDTFDQNSFVCLRCGRAERPRDTSEGYGCECREDHWVVQDTGSYGPQANGLKCSRCDPSKSLRPTREKDACIKCPPRSNCKCKEDEIEIERNSDGSLKNEVLCVPCADGLRPSNDRSACVPCRYHPVLASATPGGGPGGGSGGGGKCDCDLSAGGICLPANLEIPPDRYTPSARDEVVLFPELGEVRSAFFKEHVKVGAYMCNRFANWTACQMLANICTLSLHNTDHPACKYFDSYLRGGGGGERQPTTLPHLYFGKAGRNMIGREEEISNVYKASDDGSRLNFTVARYSLRGELLGLDAGVSGAFFQMCPGSFAELDAAFDFGTTYSRRCKIPARQLFAEGEPVFYDLYVPYLSKTEKETHLFAVPMLMRNLGGSNLEDDPDDWELTSRFFLVDRVSAVPTSQYAASLAESQPKAVRYLSKMELRIEMLDTRENPEKAGRMYPPVAVIEYGEVSIDDLAQGKKVEFEFSVKYKMEMREAKKDIGIAVGVLSAFAAVWSCVETWSWHRRSGMVGLDPILIVKLVAVVAGNLANVFFCVIFFTCLYWFVFYKEQNFLHAMLPSEDQERIIKDYVISIFALKIIDVGHLMVSQMNVDVFLLDWERPRPVTVPPRAESAASATSSAAAAGAPNGEGVRGSSVSAWRTYLVANEWNELQALRKTTPALQVFVVVFILKICGVENLATADARSVVGHPEDVYIGEHSYVCRFVLFASVYLGVSFVQAVVWNVFNYCPVADGGALQRFVDLCSLANISVFVMSNNNFGFYIHGKSAHGVSDTDMATLIKQLQREADDLCGHRGLQAGSDDQTFTMALPGKLRTSYDRITKLAAEGRGPRIKKLSGQAIKDITDAYTHMNRFLSRFLEHALQDLDYDVRDKLFLEKVLDCEFYDVSVSDKAVFYSDNGHSFDSVLLYGNEFSLTMFDMMVFLFVDLFARDALLAGIITFAVAELFKLLRGFLGKKNLAHKTLIDSRFLI